MGSRLPLRTTNPDANAGFYSHHGGYTPFAWSDAPVERVSGADAPLPYAKNLEQACIPKASDVVRAANKALGAPA